MLLHEQGTSHIRHALVLLVALTTPVSSAIAECAAELTGAGLATSYSDAAGSGACGFADGATFVAAVGPADYAGSQMCGRFLRVTGPLGSVDVRVVDLCPTCAAGDLDLNTAAFEIIANPGAGGAAITWSTIPDPSEGSVFLQISVGSNPFFLQIQPLYSRYGIASLEYLSPSGYVSARRELYNHYTVDGSSGVPVPLASPFTVRLTDVNGQQLVMGGIPLVAGHLHASGIQFPVCSATGAPSSDTPPRLALRAPTPNPSRRATLFTFELPRDDDVSLRLYDAAGRRVRTLVQQRLGAGRHQAEWRCIDDSGRPVAPGVYFCRLASSTDVDQRQVVLTD